MSPHSYSASPKIFNNAMASANFRVSSNVNPSIFANPGENFIESSIYPAQNITGVPEDSSSVKPSRNSFSYPLPSLGYSTTDGQQQYAQLNQLYPYDEIKGGDEFLNFGQYPTCFDDYECDKIEEISVAMQSKENRANEYQQVPCLKLESSSLAAVQQVSDENNAFQLPFVQQQNYFQPKVQSYPIQQMQKSTQFQQFQGYQQLQVNLPEQQQIQESYPWMNSEQYNSYDQQSYAVSSQQPQYQQSSQQYQQQLSYPQKFEYPQQTQKQEQSQGQQNFQHIDYYNIYTQQCSQKLKSQDSVSTSNQNQSNLVQQENNTQEMASQISQCNPNGNFTQVPHECLQNQPHLETSHSHSSASSHCGDSDHHTLPLFSFPDVTKIPANTTNSFDFFSFFSNKNPQESIHTAGFNENSVIIRNKAQTGTSTVSSSRTLSQGHGKFQPLKHEEEDTHHHEVTEKQDDCSHNCNFYSSQQAPCGTHSDNTDFYSVERKQQITAAMQQSNKKNVVRNLMRAFKQYFLQKRFSEPIMCQHFSDSNLKDVQQKFKRYFAQRKFNHNSIKQLVQHEKYGDIFHEFLKEHSQAYLKNSFVKKQELHQVFIDFLLLCFRDETLLDHLETYSKIKNPFQ